MARKRSYRQMSCDYGGIEVINDTNASPFYFEPSKYQQNKKKEIMTKKMDKNKMKNKYNFAYIDNPKPCKRQKLCNYDERITISKAINIDTKPKKLIAHIPNSKLINCISDKDDHRQKEHKNKKGQILHHCVLIERWNLLTSKKKKKPCKDSNLPILSLLNEITPKQPQQSQQSHQRQYQSQQSLHYRPKTQSINYSDSDTDSLSSYESAYNYFNDDNLPTMSINEPLDDHNDGSSIQTVQNYCNDNVQYHEHQRSMFQQSTNNKDNVNVNYLNPTNPWNHEINTNNHNPQNLYNPPNRTTNKNSYDFKWNINDHNDRIQIQGQPPVSMNMNMKMNMNMNDSTGQNKWGKDGTDYFSKIIRFLLYALIICLMIGYQFGLSFSSFSSFCNTLNIGIMCEDVNKNNKTNLKLMEKGDGVINDSMYNKEWFYFLKWMILTIILAISMCYCLIKGNQNKSSTDNEQFRFKYDQNTNSNINYFNHQHVTVNNHFVFNK